jgi:hypothetical protein
MHDLDARICYSFRTMSGNRGNPNIACLHMIPDWLILKQFIWFNSTCNEWRDSLFTPSP